MVYKDEGPANDGGITAGSVFLLSEGVNSFALLWFFTCVCPERLKETTKVGFLSTDYFGDLG